MKLAPIVFSLDAEYLHFDYFLNRVPINEFEGWISDKVEPRISELNEPCEDFYTMVLTYSSFKLVAQIYR